MARRLAKSANAASRRIRYERMERAGLSPFVCMSDVPTTKAEARRRLETGQLMVPNLSGFYHGILKGWWEEYGLGERSLLISETKAVSDVFGSRYPSTNFLTTDYFVELQPNPTCDVLWDICSDEIPSELMSMQSVICQATFEHILDPVQAIRNFSRLLSKGGMIYMQTHTPAYQYHGWPRDYLRYFPDWFEDICSLIPELTLVELLCIDGHAFAAFRKH